MQIFKLNGLQLETFTQYDWWKSESSKKANLVVGILWAAMAIFVWKLWLTWWHMPGEISVTVAQKGYVTGTAICMSIAFFMVIIGIVFIAAAKETSQSRFSAAAMMIIGILLATGVGLFSLHFDSRVKELSANRASLIRNISIDSFVTHLDLSQKGSVKMMTEMRKMPDHDLCALKVLPLEQCPGMEKNRLAHD